MSFLILICDHNFFGISPMYFYEDLITRGVIYIRVSLLYSHNVGAIQFKSSPSPSPLLERSRMVQSLSAVETDHHPPQISSLFMFLFIPKL